MKTKKAHTMFLGLALATALPASAQQGQGGSGSTSTSGQSKGQQSATISEARETSGGTFHQAGGGGGGTGTGTSETTGSGGASDGGGMNGMPHPGNHPNHFNGSGPAPGMVIEAIQEALQGKAVKSGPAIFLGVAVSPAPPELSHLMPDQASLPAQTGLVVNHIEKDSPADKAGLQEGDVLAKLDDQILMLPEQLAILVSGRKEGEGIRLTYLRKGESREATATLVTRASPAGIGRIKIGDTDVIIDGNGVGRSLRTFTRTFSTSGGSPGAPGPESDVRWGVSDGPAPAPEIAPGTPKPDAEVLERLQKIEATLIELKNSIKR